MTPKDPPRVAVNSIDALCRGASEGMVLSINVMAMLIAFVALVAMANFLLGWPQQALLGIAQPVTMEALLGWINAPFAWLMGVPAQDCVAIGQVLGKRIVLNEFIGYLSLTSPDLQVAERSFTIATYALCGFANFSSIAIQVGGIGSLAGERRSELARLGVRAMIGGVAGDLHDGRNCGHASLGLSNPLRPSRIAAVNLREKLVAWEDLPAWRAAIRAAGKAVGGHQRLLRFAASGHVLYLESARNLGDVMLVGLNGDAGGARAQGRRPSREYRE